VECCSSDLLKERKEGNSPRAVYQTLYAGRAPTDFKARRGDWSEPTGGITSRIMLPSTFGGLANANISDTSLNR
jgi:hypothetical protein